MTTRRAMLQQLAAIAATGPMLSTSVRSAFAQPARKFPGITLSVLSSSGHRQFNPVWDKFAELEQETGIKVALTRVPTGEIRQKIMQDLVMGATQFDVYEIPDDTIFSASQYLTSLEPFIKQDFGSVQAWGQYTVPWALKAAAVRGDVRLHPFYSGTSCAVFRDSLFRDPANISGFKTKFGYDLPAPPKTWKEFLDVAQFFTRQQGSDSLWGVVLPGKQDPGRDVLECFIFEEGVTYLDDANHCNWGPKHTEHQATVTKVAQFLQDLVHKQKVAPPTVPGMSTNETVELYLNGKAAMLVDDLYFAWDEIKSKKVTDRIGTSTSFMVPTTSGSGKGGIPFYWMFGVSERSKAKEAAWAFIRWFMREDNLKLTLTKGIGVYVPTDTRLGEWAAQQNVLPPAIIPAIRRAQVYRLNPQIGQVRTVLKKWVEKLYLNELTPQDFTIQSGNEIEQLMVSSGLISK